jgi:hypothetical protein
MAKTWVRRMAGVAAGTVALGAIGVAMGAGRFGQSGPQQGGLS